jgi:hypothetical protein
VERGIDLMSRVVAPALRNGFPFNIQNGELWDGSTFSVNGNVLSPDNPANEGEQFSGDAGGVFGPGTLAPVGFTLQQLVKLWWRIKTFHVSGSLLPGSGDTTPIAFDYDIPRGDSPERVLVSPAAVFAGFLFGYLGPPPTYYTGYEVENFGTYCAAVQADAGYTTFYPPLIFAAYDHSDEFNTILLSTWKAYYSGSGAGTPDSPTSTPPGISPPDTSAATLTLHLNADMSDDGFDIALYEDAATETYTGAITIAPTAFYPYADADGDNPLFDADTGNTITGGS